MNLLLSLVLEHGRILIVSLLDTPPPVVNVLVRGFSAGSFVGPECSTSSLEVACHAGAWYPWCSCLPAQIVGKRYT